MSTPILALCDRIKLGKILKHIGIEICMVSKSMLPLETIFTYHDEDIPNINTTLTTNGPITRSRAE
jgi:hypothetical protein